ncbi:MAG: amidase [Burkholderiaceae bacterium]
MNPHLSDPLLDNSATALSEAIHAKYLSCRELMQATLEQIDSHNPRFNAIVSRLDSNAVLAQADVCDRELANGQSRGWMHGFPMAIKDLADTAGVPTVRGSPLLVDNVPQHDELMVARMKAAGGILIAKTNTPEFGLGSHTYNPVFGITRNAYDARRSAGGSSGGAAVALALRMLPVADGSDMMGSLRNPAAFNNVFGLRPSAGRVPAWPKPDVWIGPLGTEGPMGRTVEDVARLLAIQAGRDDRVPLSLPGQWPGQELDLTLDLRAVRIGWLGDLGGYLAMEPGILPLCRSALARLAADGCQVEEARPAFDPAQVWRTWLTWRRWLVAGNLREYWDVPASRAQLKPAARWEAEQGEMLSARDVQVAAVERSRFYQQMLGMFERYDFIALPSAQVWPFEAELDWPRSIAGKPMDTYHRWMEVVIYATLAGLPAISVPVGFGPHGLPAGMQLIGRPQADLQVLRVARAYEQRIPDILARRPPALG